MLWANHNELMDLPLWQLKGDSCRGTLNAGTNKNKIIREVSWFQGEAIYFTKCPECL